MSVEVRIELLNLIIAIFELRRYIFFIFLLQNALRLLLKVYVEKKKILIIWFGNFAIVLIFIVWNEEPQFCRYIFFIIDALWSVI